MRSIAKMRREARLRRHARVRKRVFGTAARPRLSVFRSARHIYAQLIDDEAGVTLAAASTLSPELRDKNLKRMEAAVAVGTLIAQKANALGITAAVYDRGGYLYHGRVMALADAARATGLDMGPPSNREEVLARKAKHKKSASREELPKAKTKGTPQPQRKKSA